MDFPQFAAAIGPNLDLTAPSGMNEASRVSWIKSAYMTIGDIPAAILQSALLPARLTCDHPAKIIPAIHALTKDGVKLARENYKIAQKRYENRYAPKLESHGPEYMTADDLAELKAEATANLKA